MPNVNAFEPDRGVVLDDLHKGTFDYLEVASPVSETRFFRYLLEEGNFKALAATYPTPRKKEEVPLWIYLASQLTLRLHGQHAYSTYPFIVHCGGLRDALGPEQVKLTEDLETGQRRLRCEGYNEKNSYERRTPCDQDFLRKLAKDTGAEALQGWYNTAVAQYLRDFGAFDPDGVFLLDGSYLFVPDNEHYEKSSRLRFDEHNHPLSKAKYEALTPTQKDKTRWRRCYRAVFLLHMDQQEESYPFAGFSLMEGRKSEQPKLRELVDLFVNAVGPGVMKTLIFDRGFLDGEVISHLKKDHHVDTLFPLRSNMLDYRDAWVLGVADESPWLEWRPPPRSAPEDPPDRPEFIRRREKKRQETLAARRAEAPAKLQVEKVELKVIPEMRLWTTTTVPLRVLLLRETLTDGTVSEWCLATTREDLEALEIWDLYKQRTAIEERHRQLKCFWDLTGFRSRSFSLVTAQVTFVLLAYSLLQAFLRKLGRGEINPKTRETILRELRWEDDKLVLYSGNRFAYFTPLEYQGILLRLPEGARRRILAKTDKLRQTMMQPTSLPHRPGV